VVGGALGIASRSLRGNASLELARNAFIGRLQALSYGTLTDQAFEGAALDEIIADELAVFAGRAKVEGLGLILTAKVKHIDDP